MKQFFESIFLNYQIAAKLKHKKSSIGFAITDLLPQEISRLLGNEDRYKVVGSYGKGNWASIPWIAVFDTIVTKSAQTGYYPVYLFRDDMSGFYLSLNQGVTTYQKQFKGKAKDILKIKSAEFRERIGRGSKTFTVTDIQLNKLDKSSSKYAPLYEYGNVIAKFYPSNEPLSDLLLSEDLLEMISIYDYLVRSDDKGQDAEKIELDEEDITDYEDLTKFRFHKRIERRYQVVKKVKNVKGYTCEVCKLNFENAYGEIGKNFIEAHHLVPISKLGSIKIRLNVKTDFAVLCSNCHSMIHKLEDPSDIKLLREIIRANDKI